MPSFPARLSRLVPLALLTSMLAEPVVVRHQQGSIHAFLVLQTLEGHRIATGDVTQEVHGDRVTSRVTFRFRDGSVDDDTTVFTQHNIFRLITNHRIQRGPSFPKPTDILIDAQTGQVIAHTPDGKTNREHMDLPPDISNGLPPNLLLNLLPSASETRLSFVAPSAKPRLVHVTVKPESEVPFTLGDSRRKATNYVLHVELGGVAGIVAPMIGKQPADYHIWILNGPTPAFIREEGQFYEGGPIWRVEQVSPSFPR